MIFNVNLTLSGIIFHSKLNRNPSKLDRQLVSAQGLLIYAVKVHEVK